MKERPFMLKRMLLKEDQLKMTSPKIKRKVLKILPPNDSPFSHLDYEGEEIEFGL